MTMFHTPPKVPFPDLPPLVALRPAVLTSRLKVRHDEAAKRKIADTDGTRRRARQVAKENRLI